jgi:hypothetical protein
MTVTGVNDTHTHITYNIIYHACTSGIFVLALSGARGLGVFYT